MRIHLLCLALLTLLSSPTTAAAEAGEVPIEEQCQAGFDTQGNFLHGGTLRGRAVALGVNSEQAVQRIAQALALQGQWRNVDADRELGIIGATMSALGDHDAITPLNIVVRDSPEGALLTATFSAAPGSVVAVGRVRGLICDALAAAAG